MEVFIFKAFQEWRSSSPSLHGEGVFVFEASSARRSSSLSLLGVEAVFISKPSWRGGLHLQGHPSTEVFIFKAIPAQRFSFLSLLGEHAFVFEAFSRALGERLLVSELLVLRYAPLAPLGWCS
jgi:hypothetical protein